MCEISHIITQYYTIVIRYNISQIKQNFGEHFICRIGKQTSLGIWSAFSLKEVQGTLISTRKYNPETSIQVCLAGETGVDK